MAAPHRRHRGPAPGRSERELVIDHECRRGSWRNLACRQALGIGCNARDPNLDFGPSSRVAPRRQRGCPELGGDHPLHPLSRPCHELLDDIADRASAFHDAGDGLDRFMQTGDRPRQPLEPFSLLT